MAALLLPVAVDKGGELGDKRLGLLPMRKVAGAGDHFETGVGNRTAPILAIGRSDDPVFGAPQQQSRGVDPMQPTLEPRVVHIGLPAVEGESLAAANDGCELAVGKGGEFNLAFGR